MEILNASKDSLNQVPLTPGVYLFRNEDGKVIYVGKAKALRNRLRSYWAVQLIQKTKQMMSEAQQFSYIQVGTEFEALLLESALVKKYRPKYNIELKDDKSPLYIGVTKETYPRIITYRQTQLDEKKDELKEVYGPFINGRSARSVLKRIRKAIPFSTHRPTKRACIYAEIGLCNPCPSDIENTEDPVLKNKLKKKYQRNIRNIQRILDGDIQSVQKQLEKEMRDYASQEEYELAQQSQRSLLILNSMTEPKQEIGAYMENPNFIEDVRERESRHLRKILEPYFSIETLNRVECFDIAHLAGTYPTASMVTFVNGEADKTYYRHFRVSDEDKNNDVDSMRSILKRRQKHIDDWGKPDLIIVDGGKGQLSAALEVFSKEFPVIGLAKRLETVVIRTNDGFKEVRAHGPALLFLQRIRDEAHRFARRYHHKLVSKAIIKGVN